MQAGTDRKRERRVMQAGTDRKRERRLTRYQAIATQAIICFLSSIYRHKGYGFLR